MFGRQLGLALAGATSLWGAVFLYKSQRVANAEQAAAYRRVAARLFLPFWGGMAVALASWIGLLSATALAHEGIGVVPTHVERLAAVPFTATPFFVFFGSALLLFVALRLAPQVWRTKAYFSFFVAALAVVLFLISFPAWTGQFDRTQLFYIGHSAHSIFTLGTVITLDFLFVVSHRSSLLKQHIYPHFRSISKVIWVGLGIDFLSVALVFGDAIALTPKFFFMQTVVGILIINGVILGGPIGEKLLRTVKSGARDLAGRWATAASISGTISITSWTTITFVDSFEHLTFGYGEFLLGYAGWFLVLFAGHFVWEQMEKRRGEGEHAL